MGKADPKNAEIKVLFVLLRHILPVSMVTESTMLKDWNLFI
jgi:hypothetical protein